MVIGRSKGKWDGLLLIESGAPMESGRQKRSATDCLQEPQLTSIIGETVYYFAAARTVSLPKIAQLPRNYF